jgi:alginate O-acetyltransferase complex protein AlgI
VVFGSAAFLKFMVLALVGFHLAPPRHRWAVLLALSLAYYASFRALGLIVVLVAVALAAWLSARRIAETADERAQTLWLRAGVGAILAALIGVRVVAAGALGWDALPGALRLGSTIGVSYFTLQAIAYVADVYWGKLKPEPSLGRVMLSLAFFPKLAQGPIERGRKLLPQLRTLSSPAYPVLRTAALLFAWGMFKKAVLADRLALIVDPVYAEPERYGGLAAVVATYVYAFQIYFDFSGYTDMARGVAYLFGVELSENFSGPYLATSITEFWRRWHMTFSRWLLDYIFTPLQLQWRALRRWGTALALMATFSISGIWHGATWCFAIWGMLHGLFLASSSLTRGAKPGPEPGPLGRAARIALTFNMVALTWVFFRAPALRNALALLRSVARPTLGIEPLIGQIGAQSVAVTLLACGAYVAVVALKRLPWWTVVQQRPLVRWSAYAVLGTAILVLGQSSAGYIYFQF